MKNGAAQPYILVAPTITVLPGHDTECVDVPRGPTVATWLTEDIRHEPQSTLTIFADMTTMGTVFISKLRVT